MATKQEETVPVSPEIKEDKDDSASNSDKEMDNDKFEDAQDTAQDSVQDSAQDASSIRSRSLTRRPPSNSQAPATAEQHDDSDDEYKKLSKTDAEDKTDPATTTTETATPAAAAAATATVTATATATSTGVSTGVPTEVSTVTAAEDNGPQEETDDQRQSSVPPAHRISVTSNGELDNVSLDDDNSSQPKAPPPPANMSPSEKAPKKTLSLSNITNVLPSMPWSPPSQDSPTKNLSPPAGATPPAPKEKELPAPPPPPSRKLTSAFSWLSRSSSKDLGHNHNTSPPSTSPRRNTGSSVATLTSNPEMMLGRLDEEGKPNGGNGTSRHSLKDRFKAMRMREEAGITSLPEDDDKTGLANLVNKAGPTVGPGAKSAEAADEKDAGLAVQPPVSPAPPSPNANLAPGTASGASAGPSALSDQPVDWDLWQSVVYEGPAAVAKSSAEELNKAIATGIPSAIRGVIWQVLADSKDDDLEAVYRELVARGTDKDRDRRSNSTLSISSNGHLSIQKEPISSASSVHSDHSATNGSPSPPSEKDHEAMARAAAEHKKKQKVDRAIIQRLEKTIRRDLGARTSYSKFAAAQGLQEGAFGVCKAYALFDEEVGYAQGMNFLVMPLLFNMPEEEAFCLLVRLMNHYHLRDLFIHDMPGLHSHLYQFERLLEDTEPALYCHLKRRGISPHLYATQWFLTLFSYRFPLQLVLRIYDLILSEGLSAIIKFGIVLMQKNTATLLGMSDMSQLTTYLRDRLFDVYIEATPSAGSILENGFFGSSSSSIDKEVYRADQLVHDACEIKITPELLKFYKAEWEEKTKVEKEREVELETLRSQNISYAAKLRKLEERLETVDREQAGLATELVHTKVENEELKDENESLRGQVRELKIVIEKQPVEIENQWKLERDDLMHRNARVHAMNEKVEKEMSELEEELVATKMKYAEINSSHETLQRKWTELSRQFQSFSAVQ